MATRLPLVAGNWKMHMTIGEAVSLVEVLRANLDDLEGREVLVCPPFTALLPVGAVLEGSPIGLGAQNLYPEGQGPHTGEISPAMLVDIGCRYVILGHSERRHGLGEDDDFINRKVRATLEHGVRPLLCVGETLDEREADQAVRVVSRQLRKGLTGLTTSALEELVVAYEPVWAIGTGRTATTEQAREMHRAVRDVLRSLFADQAADQVRILYGGSVTPENVDALMAQPDVDGCLVGGASLDAGSFSRIARFRNPS
ncbi:MAG: triose-phosphate isomerase [Anaerolineae bacterium]